MKPDFYVEADRDGFWCWIADDGTVSAEAYESKALAINAGIQALWN